MGLTPTFKMADIRAALQASAKQLEKAILRTLSYLGELCVEKARTNHTYVDQTGNLTASIGYVIAHNGQILRSRFLNPVTANKPKKTAKSGAQTGEALAKELAAEFTQGWCLIIVAGMNYAAAVESRGLNVLSTAEHLAQSELPKLLADLKLTVNSLQ